MWWPRFGLPADGREPKTSQNTNRLVVDLPSFQVTLRPRPGPVLPWELQKAVLTVAESHPAGFVFEDVWQALRRTRAPGSRTSYKQRLVHLAAGRLALDSDHEVISVRRGLYKLVKAGSAEPQASLRSEILKAISQLPGRGTQPFRFPDVWKILDLAGTTYPRSSLGAYMSSAMTVGAPVSSRNAFYQDLQRVGRGLYVVVQPDQSHSDG